MQTACDTSAIRPPCGVFINYIIAIGNACRYKLVGFLRKKYVSPKEAEDQRMESPSGSSSQISNPISSDHTSVQESSTARILTQSAECQINVSLPTGSSLDLVTLSKLFSELVGSDIHIPEDYLIYTAQAMHQLSVSGRSNVLYKLSKGIGTMRPDNSDSCFPCKRMPMGMLEYMADFFASTVMQQVHSVIVDYGYLIRHLYYAGEIMPSRLSGLTADYVC